MKIVCAGLSQLEPGQMGTVSGIITLYSSPLPFLSPSNSSFPAQCDDNYRLKAMDRIIQLNGGPSFVHSSIVLGLSDIVDVQIRYTEKKKDRQDEFCILKTNASLCIPASQSRLTPKSISCGILSIPSPVNSFNHLEFHEECRRAYYPYPTIHIFPADEVCHFAYF